MYGAHEEELMRSAAFWAGKTTRDMTADDYEQWLAHALPHVLLKPELLCD
jgi:hypothetical protein